jgi:hypothetical protein
MTEKTAIPNMGQDARLLCEFEGFPDTVIWTKEGNVIQPSLKYFPTLSNDYGTGKTTGALIVNNVTSADFGSYTCTGSNKFGKMHSTGSLRSKFWIFSVHSCMQVVLFFSQFFSRLGLWLWVPLY